MFSPQQLKRPSLLDQLRADRDADEIYRYNRAQRQMQEASLPYAESTAQAKNLFELMRANEKGHQAGLAGQRNANEPQRFGLESAYKGAQIGKENALTGKYGVQTEKERYLAQNALSKNEWEKLLRANPLYQTKQIIGRISPEVALPVSATAALQNRSPLELSEQRPMMAYPGTQPLPGGMKRPFSQEELAALDSGPRMATEQEASQPRMEMNLNKASGQESPHPSAYARQFPNLQNSIENKIAKAEIAHLSFIPKLGFLQNIKETIQGIDPTIFRHYSGREGLQRLAVDKYKNAQSPGSAGKMYDEYKNFADNQAVILASQIRQYYGDSIQPSKEAQIQEAFNPVLLSSNPSAAIAKISELIRIIDDEGKTFVKTVPELKQAAHEQGFGSEWDSLLKNRKSEIQKKHGEFEQGKSGKKFEEAAKIASLVNRTSESESKQAVKELMDNEGWTIDEVNEYLNSQLKKKRGK